MAATKQDNASSPVGFKVTKFAHMTLPVRDIEEAKRFYIGVLGGELIHDRPSFFGVRIGGVAIGFTPQADGWTGASAEFPHYAFYVDAGDFLAVKEHLEAHGVKTHQPWTRFGTEAQMYFRDPSGNLLEIQCTNFAEPDKLARGADLGDYHPPLGDLSYEWQG